MAQRLIHFAIANELTKYIDIKDKNKFIVGSLIPDCHSSKSERDKTHYMVKNNLNKSINFTKFFNKYKDEILNNDLYLGYYIHLITDLFYRKTIYANEFIRNEKNSVSSEEFTRKIHSDYKNLNSVIKNKYNLKNIKVNIEDIPIEFRFSNVYKLQEMLNFDFNYEFNENLNYLDLNILERFVNNIVNILVEEINSIKKFNVSLLNSENIIYQ